MLWLGYDAGSGQSNHWTGLGLDFYLDHCNQNVATCKTHWPTISYRNKTQPKGRVDRMHHRYVALVRNPIHSIPSYFNYKWESTHRVKGHTVQGNEQDWREARDRWLDHNLQDWRNLFTLWRQQPYELAFYMAYEHLTDSVKGPETFIRLAQELRSAGFTSVAPDEDIPCLWYRVVKEGRVRNGDAKTQRKHKYVPGFTIQQKGMILSMLEQVKNEFSNETELVDLLTEYQEDIEVNIRIDSWSNETMREDENDQSASNGIVVSKQ